MQIRKLDNYTNYFNSKTSNNTNCSKKYTSNDIQNFTGLREQLPIKMLINSREALLEGILDRIPISADRLVDETRGASYRRCDFLFELADRFNSRNFALPYDKRENLEPLFDIFNLVRKPQKSHFNLLDQLDTSMENFSIIFGQGIDNPKFIKKVSTFYDKVFGDCVSRSRSSQIITDISASKYAETICANPDNYRAYFLYNSGDESCVAKLVEMLDTNSFDATSFQNKLEIRKLFEHNGLRYPSEFNPQSVEKDYNKVGLDLIDSLLADFGITSESVCAGNDKDLLKIYRTTTSKNSGARQDVIDAFRGLIYNNYAQKDYNENYRVLTNLFEEMDNNKDVSKFVQKIVKDTNHFKTIESLLNLVQNIPAKKLNRFYSNVLNILNQVKEQDALEVLSKEIENPFFETQFRKEQRLSNIKYRYERPESVLHRFGKYAKNKFNIFVDRYFEGSPSIEVKSTSILSGEKIVSSQPVSEQVVKSPVVQNQSVDFAVLNTSEKAQISQISEVAIDNVEVVSAKEKTVSLPINKTLSQRMAKKLLVINDVNDIISKTLGKKTLEKQQAIYDENATKMRLKLLPEIFESLKDSRKVDKAKGKKRNSSSSLSALALYKQINGANRKLINYMLKKRTADGSRMFEVKDILEVLEKSEAEISKLKEADKNFKAADRKAYYNAIFDENIEKYGKVKMQRTVKGSKI